MLAIEVAFLTGRYIATSYNARDEAEWPPHPARLFSALVATHAATDPTLDGDVIAERRALEWLEQQEAPAITCSPAARRDIVTVFTPVNDVALTNVDDEAHEADVAREALAQAERNGDTKATAKLRKAMEKSEATLLKAIKRATEVPSRSGNPSSALRVLPEHRTRRPRTFPSVTPETPLATFIWATASPSDECRAALSGLCQRVVRLGHSSSLVHLRLTDTAPAETWRPVDDGELILRVAQHGQLQTLERAFALHQETEPRVMPFRSQAYGSGPATMIDVPTSIFSKEWIILRRVGGPHLPMTSAVGVTRAVRRALMSVARGALPEVLTGHAPDGAPSVRPHLAIVPLPFVGHENATGAILGVALALPTNTATHERRAVYQAVAAWEAKHRREDEDTPAVELLLGAGGVLELERLEGQASQASLRSSTWCAPSTTWLSVTPMALDRNPGDLRTRDPQRLRTAVLEAEESVARACERIGLPKPVAVEILPAPPWAGAAKAQHYPAFPGDANRTQRVLTHVALTFDTPVSGPVILGAGRFAGLGLCRPRWSS